LPTAQAGEFALLLQLIEDGLHEIYPLVGI